MLSSSRDALLKMSVTISPQKPFPSDCITLYWDPPDVTNLFLNDDVGPRPDAGLFVYFHIGGRGSNNMPFKPV